MSRYLIGVGGTGAKCVEATVHLAAAGILPRERLFVQFVDPDGANGSVNRAVSALRAYAAVQEPLRLGVEATDELNAFRTPIEVGNPEVWTPFSDKTRRKLGDVLGYRELEVEAPTAARLFDVLYSAEERAQDLGEGFRGHPSIGAAVLAHTLSFKTEGTWAQLADSIQQNLSNNNEAHVFLTGSIFGGTGASGIPTIGRLVRDEVFGDQHVGGRLGAALALPYFSFRFGDRAENLRADASSFVPNTKAALKYYHQKGYLDIFDALYVFGEARLEEEAEASVGGNTQINTPHPAELYAALAAADFFHGQERKGLQITSRAAADRITWRDLPWMGLASVESRLLTFTRFAFAFLGVYYPVLHENPKKGRYRYPWLVDHFDLTEDSTDVQQRTESLAQYCRSYLDWLAALHGVERPALDLVEWSVFASRNGRLSLKENLSLADSDLLMLGHGNGAKGLHAVWLKMCSAPRYRNVHGFDAFVRSLYSACSQMAS